MQELRIDDASDSALQGLRVLALPVSALPLKPLLLAKARWNWHIDLFCRGKQRKEFKQLVAPSGRYFVAPATDRQAWEDDANEVARTDRLIREVESATGIPTGQVVLASGATIGIRFAAPIITLASDPNLPALPAKADNLEPSRIIRRAFRFADHMLEMTEPDLIYCFELADLWSFAVWMVAQWRGIPCVVVRRSKIRSDHCYVTTDLQMFNTAAREIATAKCNSKAGVSDAANEYIRSFREQPQMVNYIRAKWARRTAQSTWRNWHAEWARSTALKALKVTTRSSEAGELVQAGRSLFEFNRRLYKSQRHQRFLRTFSADELAAMDYIFFPVHKETDLSLYFQAAPWFDQRNTIRLLASVVPNGYRLLVREHRDNYGLRPSRYYRELLGLPNVVLIDAFDSQFKYIANADLVVTENGSSGWEGLLLGRKVLTLSTTFYDGAGRARKLEKSEDLGAAIVAMLSNLSVADSREHDLDLGRMIDAEYETTFHLHDPEAALEHITAVVRPLLAHNKRPNPSFNSRHCSQTVTTL